MFLDEMRVLSGQARFKNVDAATLKLLALAGERITFDTEEQVFSESDDAEHVFIILSGEARLTRSITCAQGHHVGDAHIGVANIGAVIGEIGVVLRQPRFATFTANTPLTVLRFEASDYLELLRRAPQLALSTIKELSRQLINVTSLHLQTRGCVEADQAVGAAPTLQVVAT